MLLRRRNVPRRTPAVRTDTCAGVWRTLGCFPKCHRWAARAPARVPYAHAYSAYLIPPSATRTWVLFGISLGMWITRAAKGRARFTGPSFRTFVEPPLSARQQSFSVSVYAVSRTVLSVTATERDVQLNRRHPEGVARARSRARLRLADDLRYEGRAIRLLSLAGS